MFSLFQSAPGTTIPFPEDIQEKFQIYEDQMIRANISFEKLLPVLTDVYQSFPEPLFFALHLPLTLPEEQQLGQANKLHEAVYYLDGQTQEQIRDLLQNYGSILLADGFAQFAIASHSSHEEIFIREYKVTEIYASSPRRFVPILQRRGIYETSRLTTVWDTFSQDSPGTRKSLTINGVDLYTVAEQLKEKGLYRAKTIESS